MADEELYFMRIDEPVELRKNVLEGTRILIHVLQRYEQIKSIRQQKAMELGHLRQVMKEIGQLMIELKKILPAVEVKQAKMPVEIKSEKYVQHKGKPVSQKRDDGELRSLEKELKMVEEKLARLS